MPFAIGEYEIHLSKMGIIVATRAQRVWGCSICAPGHLILTRDIDGEGRAAPARFICDHCGAGVDIHPDKGGGVQPALKGMSRGDMGAQMKQHMNGGWT